MAKHAEDSVVFTRRPFKSFLPFMLTCVILKPCEITNVIYFFFVLDGHYPLFWEVDADKKEKTFTVISFLEHLNI